MKKLIIITFLFMATTSAWAGTYSLYGTNAINQVSKISTYSGYAQCENSKWTYEALYTNLRCVAD
jgi:hypothetical protein